MRQILLLRGINLGPSRRIKMPELRELLTEAGYEDVRTYVQSGNVVLQSRRAPARTAEDCARRIREQFGFEVPVIARTRDELAQVVARNPLKEVAENPKRYQVSFLEFEPSDALVEELAGLARPGERFEAVGRELYAWHPDGVARSKLWNRLAGKELGATARNWTTVTTLLELADQ